MTRILKKELWPHKVALNTDDTDPKIDEIEHWLSKNLGRFTDRWNAVYKHTSTDYYFRQGRDATMFTLRWS